MFIMFPLSGLSLFIGALVALLVWSFRSRGVRGLFALLCYAIGVFVLVIGIWMFALGAQIMAPIGLAFLVFFWYLGHAIWTSGATSEQPQGRLPRDRYTYRNYGMPPRR